MKIREVKNSDHGKLANYLVSYWKSRGMPQFTIPWTLRYLKNGMMFEIREKRFAKFDNNNITGTIALLMFYENVAEIRDEIWKDNRTGSELLKHLIEYAKKKKINKIYSLSLKGKTKFYKAHGFVKEGILKDQFKKGEDVTIMSKFL